MKSVEDYSLAKIDVTEIGGINLALPSDTETTTF